MVAVVRRLDSFLPSQWQERVKSGVTLSWAEWLRIVLDPDSSDHREWRNVWHAHDVRRLIDDWAEVVGPERLTLVVNDGVDRELLPRTFEQLLGLPAGLLDPDPSRSNPSLSWAEVELVRSTHEAFAALRIDRVQRRPWTAAGLVRQLRDAGLPPAPPALPPFPAWAAERVRELGASRAQAVRDTVVRVVGDSDGLLPREPLAVGTADALPDLPQAAVAVAVRALVQTTVERAPGLNHEEKSYA